MLQTASARRPLGSLYLPSVAVWTVDWLPAPSLYPNRLLSTVALMAVVMVAVRGRRGETHGEILCEV